MEPDAIKSAIIKTSRTSVSPDWMEAMNNESNNQPVCPFMISQIFCHKTAVSFCLVVGLALLPLILSCPHLHFCFKNNLSLRMCICQEDMQLNLLYQTSIMLKSVIRGLNRAFHEKLWCLEVIHSHCFDTGTICHNNKVGNQGRFEQNYFLQTKTLIISGMQL